MATKQEIDFEKELWETAVSLRGTVAPADYKHYVLPMLFLRYLSLRYEARHEQIERLLKEQGSEYYTGDTKIDQQILKDPVEYERVNVFVVPEEAQWNFLRRNARSDDIKIKLDAAMSELEKAYLAKLQGVLPRIFADSALTVDQVAGLINLFSKDVFASRSGVDLLGRTYEYFISNFASTEGNRGVNFLRRRPSSSCWWRCWSRRAAKSLTPPVAPAACLYSLPALQKMPAASRFTDRSGSRTRCVSAA